MFLGSSSCSQNLSLPTFTREHCNSNNCVKCVYTVTTVVNSPFLFPRVTCVQKPGVITYSCTVWSDDVTLCLLWLTAFCVFSFYFYQTDHSYEVEVSIPLSSIFDIKKFSKKNLPKDKQMFLLDGFEIFCSNIQSHRVSALYSSCNSVTGKNDPCSSYYVLG